MKREEYRRTFALDDISISRSHSDGRTVEAYAAVFDTPVEVKDRHGHYIEVIDRAAFNRTLKNNSHKVVCLYNHGFTLHGTPSDLGSVPIGTPLEIRADNKGVFTVTRYNRSELADSVLESIRNGDIRGQSFTGRIFRSSPNGKIPKGKPGELPTVRRLELGLSEYGPTPVPVYEAAEIMAVRSIEEIADELAHLDEDALAELVRTLTSTSQNSEAAVRATPGNAGLGSEDSPDRHSVRLRALRLRSEIRDRGVMKIEEAE
ncbi:HK97 family phage prohead protease [Micromonospora sp. NPDC049891]|uniref:HK97 family phage prohead protease n=1 Tax=Micromonospora sp. NPDC049891 TaxID=3155655 RepID=UPI0033D2384A